MLNNINVNKIENRNEKFNFLKIVRKINQWQQLQFDSNYNFLPPSDPCKYTGGVVRSEFDCEKNEFIYTTGNWWKNRCYTL